MNDKVEPGKDSYCEVYIKGIHDNFYMRGQMRKVKEIVYLNQVKRLCVKVEMITGDTDYVPLCTQGKEWVFCDRLGSVIEVA